MTTKSIIKEKILLKVKKPSMYDVLLFNDEKTTFEFVINIIVNIFNKKYEEAEILTLKIHNEGQAIVGTYPLEIAKSKKEITDKNSQINNFPLVCSLEKRDA